MINALALETAKRIYVPNDRISKEDFLKEFGYKKRGDNTEKTNSK